MVLIKYSGKYVKIYFDMKITYPNSSISYMYIFFSISLQVNSLNRRKITSV